jgi:hypothetical protein
VSDRIDRLLGERFAAAAEYADDRDWAEVLQRARHDQAERRPGRRRTPVLVAAAVAVALLVVPPIGLAARIAGLGTDLADEIFGAEQEFRRSHGPDVLPRQLFVASAGPERIVGRVGSDLIASVEVQFADGGSVELEPGERGMFLYDVPAGRQPELLVARAENGALVESVPLPGGGPGPLGTRTPRADCPIGRAPTAPSPRVEGEGVRLVLGCFTLPNAQRIELVGYRIGNRHFPRGHFCIDVTEVPSGLASGCGTTRGWDGIAVHGLTIDQDGRRRLAGGVTSRARGIRVYYRHRRKVGFFKENPIRLDPHTLRRLGVKRRFSYWVAETPKDAAALRVEALDRGKTIAVAPASPGAHPGD